MSKIVAKILNEKNIDPLKYSLFFVVWQIAVWKYTAPPETTFYCENSKTGLKTDSFSILWSCFLFQDT